MQKIAKIRLKFSKIAEKPAKWYKNHINYQKPTNHYQNNPKIIQYYNQTSKPKNKQKKRKAACEHKISFAYRFF